MKKQEPVQFNSYTDKIMVEKSYKELCKVYEYNIGSKEPNDKELCKRLEKVLERLSQIIGEEFKKGRW